MSGAGLLRLRQLLADRYDVLRAQVARRLGGSAEMAGDALHDAYLRVAGRDDLDAVRHPQAYLVNAAVHAGIDRIRSETRLVADCEIDALFELPDEGAQPDRVALERARMDLLMQVMDELSPRQRALLIESRVNGIETAELAARWGISVVMVRREIQTAHHYCLDALERLWGGRGA
ncbi:RNA polymerase sigma-70 factor, ECF subfamily [plant metagenome]|uniref:Probable sigma-70 factor, ECF subfamily n=1 Tax=plant metagenome TaxID=1297885 RepID=A0A484V260_9ZZZZ